MSSKGFINYSLAFNKPLRIERSSKNVWSLFLSKRKRRSLSRQVSPSNSQFSRLQSFHRRPARLPAASTTPRPATAASRGLSGAFAPAPDSLDDDALQSSAIVAPLTSPAQARRDGSRRQRARAIECGLGASEAGVGWPDERRKLAAAPRPLLGALSSWLQARPGTETPRGCSIEPPGAAVWRPDSPCTGAPRGCVSSLQCRELFCAAWRARSFRLQAQLLAQARYGRLCSASSLPSCRQPDAPALTRSQRRLEASGSRALWRGSAAPEAVQLLPNRGFWCDRLSLYPQSANSRQAAVGGRSHAR